MNQADVCLIGQIQQATQGAARLLCTLARRGKALERDAPERSADLLAAVRTHPFYKGGRLAFDMLEIEDVMLEGLALDPMSTRELIQVLKTDVRGLVETLMRMGFRGLRGAGDSLRFDGDVDGAVPDTQPAASSSLPRVRLGPPPDAPTLAGEPAEARNATGRELELQASDYLYDYVVVGLLDAASEMGPSVGISASTRF